MTHVTCRLTAKNRDQLRDPTLGNRVWATFTFFLLCQRGICSCHVFVCPSFRASQACSVWKRPDELSWLLALWLPTTYIPHCTLRKFGYLQKSGYFSFELCTKLRSLKNFAMASRSWYERNSSTVELVDDPPTTVDASWLFATRQPTVTL